MTYIEFLLLFTVLPIVILLILLRRFLNKQYILTLLLVSVIAFIATSAWDNYAVYSGIWMFPPEKTLGIYLYYVPLEEYLFFFLQTYLTGLVQLYYLFRFHRSRGKEAFGNYASMKLFSLNVYALIFYIYAKEIEPLKLPFGEWNYLFHLFSWAGTFILIQFVFGRKKIIHNIKLIIVPTIIMTVYFSLADSISIGNGIWHFDPLQTIGTKIGNVPIEEILFFMMTNLLITEAMVLFLRQDLLIPKGKSNSNV